MLKPLMQSVLNQEIKSHPEIDIKQAERRAILGQELLETLWSPEPKPQTFWKKLGSALDGDYYLPQKLFNRINDFRQQHKLANKSEIQSVISYTAKALAAGTEILAGACYLFRTHPQTFKKYATCMADFDKDVTAASPEDISLTSLALGPTGLALVAGQAEQEKQRANLRSLPLLSFAPIKGGYHPALSNSTKEIELYQQMLQEPYLLGFKDNNNPNRYEPLKKLLYYKQPESRYPAVHHLAIYMALDGFNTYLGREINISNTDMSNLQQKKFSSTYNR